MKFYEKKYFNLPEHKEFLKSREIRNNKYLCICSDCKRQCAYGIYIPKSTKCEHKKKSIIRNDIIWRYFFYKLIKLFNIYIYFSQSEITSHYQAPANNQLQSEIKKCKINENENQIEST